MSRESRICLVSTLCEGENGVRFKIQRVRYTAGKASLNA